MCNALVEPDIPLKAKKKTFVEAVVEPKPMTKAAPSAFTRPPQIAGPGFVVVHQSLENLLPLGLRAMLPRLDVSGTFRAADMDYGLFIEWLRLPHFATGNTGLNWSQYIAPRLHPRLRKPLIDRLAELIELGANPQSRQIDLFFAWWELEFISPEARTQQRRDIRTDDSEFIVSLEFLKSAETNHATLNAIEKFTRLASSISRNGWNQRSVLSMLGYAVGSSGPVRAHRYVALEACLLLPDIAFPDSQREFWGVRATRGRYRAIERMINMFISLAERRTHGDWSTACQQWRQDLVWMSEKFPLGANGRHHVSAS